MRILLVEDNSGLAGHIEASLNREGMAVDHFGEMADGLGAFDTQHYDAAVLDLGLPDGDGMTLLKAVRGKGNKTPILILTARDGLSDRVDGLNGGADDYLLKPFDMEELVARLKALMRRPGGVLGVQLKAGNVAFDTVGRDVSVNDVSVRLSRRELDILEHLMRRVGRVVSKTWLEESLYGFEDEGSTNSVEVAVHRLRKHLIAAEADVAIHTLRGVGYLLQANG